VSSTTVGPQDIDDFSGVIGTVNEQEGMGRTLTSITANQDDPDLQSVIEFDDTGTPPSSPVVISSWCVLPSNATLVCYGTIWATEGGPFDGGAAIGRLKGSFNLISVIAYRNN
jgi:hypothetical protein